MNKGYNFVAAFVEYVKGETLEAIARALSIPLEALQRRCHEDGWARMAPMLPVKAEPHKIERDLAKIEANRARNYEIANLLLQDLENVARKLADGSLELDRVTSKGAVVRYRPGLAERAQLGQYAKALLEISTKCLGDVERSGGPGEKPGDSQAHGAITIVLPSIVEKPRQERHYDVEAQVVTVEKPAMLTEGEQLREPFRQPTQTLDTQVIVQ